MSNHCGDGGIHIFCPKCGKENQDGAVRCEQCFEPLSAQQNQQPNVPPAGQPGYQQNAGQYQQGTPVYTPYNQNSFTPGGNIPPCPKDYLVANIVFGILGMCGCIGLITGIIGIVFSAQVKSKYNAGDFAGAASAASVAKIMFIVNLIIAILAVLYWIVSVVLVILGYGASGFLNDYLGEYYYLIALKVFG